MIRKFQNLVWGTPLTQKSNDSLWPWLKSQPFQRPRPDIFIGRSFNWKSRWHTQFQMHLGIKNRCRPKNLREKVVFQCHERIEKLQISGANSLIEFWIFEKCQISPARYAYWGLNNILPGQFYIILQHPINGLIVKSNCSSFKLDKK